MDDPKLPNKYIPENFIDSILQQQKLETFPWSIPSLHASAIDSRHRELSSFNFIIFILIASLNYSFIHLTPSTGGLREQTMSATFCHTVRKIHPAPFRNKFSVKEKKKLAKLRDKTFLARDKN